MLRWSVREAVRLPGVESGEPITELDSLLGDPSKPVTIAAIAASAGVSIPTVSKVINGRYGVAVKTSERVQEVIDALGELNCLGALRFRMQSDVVELDVRESA